MINLKSRKEGDLCARYKPHTFDEIVGQYSTIKSIRKAVTLKNSSKCYLFYGESGCGKSSLAYVMALALNCLKPSKNGNPCCKCDNCLNIMKGKLVDYREINAAEAKGINEVRTIIEDLKLSPMFGKVKIYVLNEAHGMTKAAQDALLQDMDNMPEGAYIILTSTEATKIRGPLKNRCEAYKFNKLTLTNTKDIIDHVMALEGGIITSNIKDLIIKRSEKRPRNTLKLLQTVLNIGFGDEKSIIRAIEAEDVEESNIADLCRAVQYGKPWPTIMSIYKKLDISTEATYYIMGSWFRATLEKSEGNPKDRGGRINKNFEALLPFINEIPAVKPETYLVASIYKAYVVHVG